MLACRNLTNRIVGLVIEVHRAIGRGWLDTVHTACLKDGLRRFVV